MLAAGGQIVVHNQPEVYEIARQMVSTWRRGNPAETIS
jgi:hypothetical protein